MLAILAAVCFFVAALAAWGLAALNPVALIALGLTFVALHLVWPLTPWHRAP